MIARRIDNEASNYRRYNERALSETSRVWQFYLGDPRNPRKLEEELEQRGLIRRLRRWAGTARRAVLPTGRHDPAVDVVNSGTPMDPGPLFQLCDEWLEAWNRSHDCRILHREVGAPLPVQAKGQSP